MKKYLLILFVILAIALLALGIYYFVTPAGSLLHSLPGYSLGSPHKHAKHGIASIIIAFGFGVLAWFYAKKTS